MDQGGRSNGVAGSEEAWVEGPEIAPHLDRALLGSLPCITCGYDLKGISIRGVCPECGTAVRAAILYQVDPKAEEFQPMIMPRLTAAGLVVWSSAGLGAMLALWWLRLAEVMREALGWSFPIRAAPSIALGLGILSGVAVLTFLRPSRGSRWWHVALAAIGGLLYVPILLALRGIQHFDLIAPYPYMRYDAVVPERALYRLGLDACLIMAFLFLRPNLRDLVRRSLAMRTGRVDRQTILAMVGAVGIAGVGDAMRLIAWQMTPSASELFQGIGSLLVMLGSAFLTLGMVTAVIDSWRISRVLLLPPITLRQVLEGEPAPARG